MIEDTVKALGYLTLGTRLRRMGECLQSQTQIMLDAMDTDLPASHFPVLAALDRLGPLSVGDIADAVGTSQPGVTRMLGKLKSAGLVRLRQSSDDRRVKTVVLTKHGQQFVAHAKSVAWPAIEAAVADACRNLAGPLLVQLATLEDALADTPLNMRAAHIHAGGRHHART